MYCDIVMPDNNESDLIEMAVRLGYTSLIFLYKKEFKQYKSDRIRLGYASLTISKNKEVRNFIEANNDNRMFFERKDIDLIFGLEKSERKDFIHHRNSGLNHILVKLAKDNKISIGFSLSTLLHARKQDKAIILGRMIQNVRLCRKYAVPIVVASFAAGVYGLRSPQDMLSFANLLGLHPSESRKSITAF